MIIDALLQFSDKQALTAKAASTNVIDLGQAKPTPGTSKVLDVVVVVNEAVTGALQPVIQHCDTSNGTFTTVAAAESVTAPAAGTKFVIKVPYATKRYLRVYYDGAPTAGKVSAVMTWGSDLNEPFEQAKSLSDLW